MKTISVLAAIGLAGLVASAMPAGAADLQNGAGGIRDYGYGGTPVPAPMPFEETYKWYLRADIGTGFKSTGSLVNDGLPVAASNPDDWRELSIISFGFGKYVTPSLRTEFTVDIRPDRILASGPRVPATFTQTTASGVNTYNLNSQDGTINYQNYTFLMSGFYDFNRGGRFHPYVGAGIGLAFHQLNRADAEFYACTPAPCAAAPITATASGVSGNGFGLATQLSAGLTYDLSSRIHWDTGYRMLWQSGHVLVAGDQGLNTVGIGNHTDHEIKTGLRWDIW